MKISGLLLNDDLIYLSFLMVMGGSLILMVIIFPLWFVLHRLLAPLDNVLLKEPYFQKSEQINCLVWPLSYWKTMIYSFLIAAPNLSKRKRFKGLDQVPEVGRVTRGLAKTHFVAMCLGAVMGIIHFVYFGFFAWIYPHLSN